MASGAAPLTLTLRTYGEYADADSRLYAIAAGGSATVTWLETY
jgi:hypothetical protein